jgi:hypothetical protein
MTYPLDHPILRGEGFEGTKKEILETRKMYDLCGFDEDEEHEI